MKRFATALLTVVLVSSLSFPLPALAVERRALEAASPANSATVQQAEGNVWYVATDGHDGDSTLGTIEDPFATISYATTKMAGGDTVYVRGGTYRDEVKYVPSGTAGKPSQIRAYENETVWLTGSELVSGWEKADGESNIWVADMDWDMRAISEYSELGNSEDSGHYASSAYYDNLVFAGGDPAPEGRWPNASVDEFLDRDRYGMADRASAETLVDDDLPDGIDFTGSDIWIASGGGYESQTGTIKSYDAANHRLYIACNANDGKGAWMYGPSATNYYYITKSLKTLDSAGEWYKPRQEGKLYLYEPDGVDPNELAVEAQKRAHVMRIGYFSYAEGEYAMDYPAASYITISGINARLGSVAFGPHADHCTFEKSTVDCPDHKTSSQAYGVATGILLSGTENLVTRCEVKHAYGSAVTVWGTGNNVVNNYIHDTGYEHHEEQAAIRLGGRSHLVSHNTVHHVMRQALGGFFKSSVISYNDMYDCMRVSRDGGIVYFNAYDYENTEFHHNWLHDTYDFPADQMHVGLYMDSFTTSLVVYRNVVWGIQKYEPGNRTVNNNGRHLTYQINPNSLNNVIVNNTFVNYRPTHLNFYPNHDISGTVYLNNIFQSLSFIDGPTYYPWNWTDKWDRREQKSINGGVSRDVLEEMGAWFDKNHNLEGTFRNNTWPPIENQWTNPSEGDFTLLESSKAIDKGVEIAGVTEGYKGSAPDLGAYEYDVDPWKPGCDFDEEFAGNLASDRALNAKIPYRNLLANRGFENFMDTEGHADFDDWKETGTPQASPAMSAWSGWGWIVKEGSRCLVLDSDGDALKQRVTGLTPNGYYRLGGYAFVAGEYIRPSMLTGAKTADAAEVDESGLASLRRGNQMSMGDFRELRFGNVDFGEGRDRIIIGLRSPQYNADEKERQTISITLGNAHHVVGSYTVDKRLSTSEMNWRWVTIELDGTYSGCQDVTLTLDGNFTKTSLAGFITDRATSTDTLTISAGSESAAVNVSSLFKPFSNSYYSPHIGMVQADANGDLEVEVKMNGSDLVGYVDEVVLAEVPDGKGYGGSPSCSHVFEKGKTNEVWSWQKLAETDYFDEEYEAYVTLTCSKCGNEVSVKAPCTVEDVGNLAVYHAAYPMVGGMAEDWNSLAVPYYDVKVSTGGHGSIGVPARSVRRGALVAVAVNPDEGYELATLEYVRDDDVNSTKKSIDIKESRSFSMPKTGVSVTATFEPTLAGATIAEIEEGIYTGEAIEPVPVVMFEDEELVRGEDYEVSYADNIEVGTASLTVTGLGRYVGEQTASFEIVPADINAADVERLAPVSYTGEAHEPALEVSYGGSPLREGEDYRLVYADNEAAGTAMVAILGMGRYTGTKRVTFEIAPISLEGAEVSGIADARYTGWAHEPAPVVKLSGNELRSGTDYTVAYRDNVEAGTASVTIAAAGNYTGTLTRTFDIAPIDLSGARISGIGKKVYTGKKIKPAPTVWLGGSQLARGVDYTVSYRDNVEVGSATVTVTGKGNYSGTAQTTFKIAKHDNPLTVKVSTKSLKAKRLAKAKRTVKAISANKAQGDVTFTKTTYSRFLTVAKDTGKITVKKGAPKREYHVKVAVKASGNANYKKKTKVVTVTVKVK